MFALLYLVLSSSSVIRLWTTENIRSGRQPTDSYIIGSAGNVIVEKMYIEEGTLQMKIFSECSQYYTVTPLRMFSVVFYDTVRFNHYIRKRVEVDWGNSMYLGEDSLPYFGKICMMAL